MKSARHMFARPSRFFTCWRRKGSAGPVVAGEDEDVVALAPAAPQADGAARRDPALGDDLVEHRLGIVEQAARAFADDRIVEDRGIIAGQLPGAEEGRPVDRRLRGRAAAIRRTGAGRDAAAAAPCRTDRRRRRWRAPRRASRARSGRCARARLAERLIIVGGLRDQRLALGVGDQRRGDADRAAGVEDVDHRAFIGRVDAERGVRLAGGRAADQQRQSSCRARCISPATVTISSSDGVIRPDRPIMSALFSFAAFKDVLPRHHHAEVDHLEAVALQDHADDVLADVVDVALDGRHDDPALALGRRRSFPSPPR